MMRDFKFFHGIIRYELTELSEPELNYNLNLYDDITDTLADEIRHEIDREILRNLTGTFPFPLTGTGTINTANGFTLTTTNTGTVDYTTSTRAINTGNLHYLNHYINMGGGNRA
jgi:hypothetical protein